MTPAVTEVDANSLTLLHASSKRPLLGAGMGAVLHSIVFTVFLLPSDSVGAAPASVNVWVLIVGTVGGATAGGLGVFIGQSSHRSPYPAA